ncbi:type I restriction-modification system subunit M [Agrobacterium larrymoorei]|uniref:site-specific DNA-methyltransferase (adenine-specific) n=1 Tax=Agrobacterium larrymoorei TaxID=160699 RepID=A0AAF0HC53_9HYPH|nr:class I SAM-dependent DNA methyltransferase [Agrobacterium larrymoorei]WHA42967.1 class I SAM-dependent DNA methyltransferase [Agrobacterium larrymoorei]
MLAGEIRSKVDQVWNAFWAGGIANPLEVIEQITYLLFMRGLDDIQTREENKANMLGRRMERVIFPDGVYRTVRDEETGDVKEEITYAMLRWSRLRNDDPARMFFIVSENVFPFLRDMGEKGTAHAEHMKGARFTIPTPGLLAKVVDMLAEIPLEDRDTKGDLYEYMLGKIASAGQNGQFRTPRHIIKLMVELTAPTEKDVICDPASGTCGFLVAAGEYLRDNHPKLFQDKAGREHFHNGMFHGYDFDQTMLRIGSMNMQLHGVEGADIRYRDSLASSHGDDADKYSLILANPPFAGSLDEETASADLRAIVKTKKTELLFMALFLKLLKPGGRAAVIVPDGVLFGSSTAHKAIRKMLVDDHKLDAVVKLPSGVFKPYAGVSTAIIFFSKTNSGGTENVWFYDVQADGMSLDDRRQMLVSEEKFGPVPKAALSAEEHVKNNLPDIVARWKERGGKELANPRTGQSFTVSRDDIAAAGYDLSLNRYKEVVHEVADHRQPKEIIAELLVLEDEIAAGLQELEAML